MSTRQSRPSFWRKEESPQEAAEFVTGEANSLEQNCSQTQISEGK